MMETIDNILDSKGYKVQGRLDITLTYEEEVYF